MKRYILTGAPGAGKTVILRRLELAGFAVVEEAATDLIALATARGVEEHWREPDFVDGIVDLQVRRQRRAEAWPDDVVVFDRSPICTLALCEFLGRPAPPALTCELERIERERTYDRTVFFLELLGFITPTDARRITLEDSERFAAVHADVYRRLGYDCMSVPPGDIESRFEAIRRRIFGGR
ncbi:MAG TPA: AAA family ATPase [Caulobacteraceae bacterium]|nr:AAA family ATPase [Caulobacteraceae bacterium]